MIERMEQQYQCRYEAPVIPSKLHAFPVTHVILGSTTSARYVCISLSNMEIINWVVYDVNGNVLIHGHQRNHARTKAGYFNAIRWALLFARGSGRLRRVYPRDPKNRRRMRPDGFWPTKA